MAIKMAVLKVFLCLAFYPVLVAQDIVSQDFKVDCVRPLGMRITPSADFRILQTGCRGAESNLELLPPYDVSDSCLIATDTGVAVQVILEEGSSASNLVGGFLSRVFVVSCDFPGSDGYKATFNRRIQSVRQPTGIDPTATSGVFKYTGILMAIIDKATFTAAKWAEHLMSSALIGQELYLTISHPQRDEGQAFIIPRTCRARPETGNFTTLWNHESQSRRCIEVNGIAREPIRIFSDVIDSTTDVMSLQFFGFQFLGHEDDVITFECDVLLCGNINSGSCGAEWNQLHNVDRCITSQPPFDLGPGDGRAVRRRRSAPNDTSAGHLAANNGSTTTPPGHLGRSLTTSSSDHEKRGYFVQQETVRVEIRMVMPRPRLHQIASGNSILPSSAVAILLTSFVRLFQEG